jgi:hypothetical protein
MVKPISLRVYQTAVTVRARKLLRELDERDRQQRRVRWQAQKAAISIKEMASLVTPGDRARWASECKQALSFLEKIWDPRG